MCTEYPTEGDIMVVWLPSRNSLVVVGVLVVQQNEVYIAMNQLKGLIK